MLHSHLKPPPLNSPQLLDWTWSHFVPRKLFIHPFIQRNNILLWHPSFQKFNPYSSLYLHPSWPQITATHDFRPFSSWFQLIAQRVKGFNSDSIFPNQGVQKVWAICYRLTNKNKENIWKIEEKGTTQLLRTANTAEKRREIENFLFKKGFRFSELSLWFLFLFPNLQIRISHPCNPSTIWEEPSCSNYNHIISINPFGKCQRI